MLQQYDNPLSKKLNDLINEIRGQRCSYLRYDSDYYFCFIVLDKYVATRFNVQNCMFSLNFRIAYLSFGIYLTEEVPCLFLCRATAAWRCARKGIRQVSYTSTEQKCWVGFLLGLIAWLNPSLYKEFHF